MTGLGWGTWHAERPVELHHVEAGIRIAPLLYSAKEGRSNSLPTGPDLMLGPRRIGGGDAAFTSSFAGTVIGWRYSFSRARPAEIEWELETAGEWGLRYWVLVCIEHRQGSVARYDPASGTLSVGEEPEAFRIETDSDPAMVTFHDSIDAAAAEIEARGYFHLASRGVEGRVAALRFNLEQTPKLRLSASASRSRFEEPPADGGTQRDPAKAPSASREGTPQAALQAVHDVMSWNHAFDEINGRDYTVLSRNWNRQKFGGFGVWLNDILFNGLMWSLFDAGRAQRNIDEATLRQTAHGNFPCLVTGNDAWLDRSQIPAAAFCAWCVSTRSGGGFLEGIFPRLQKNNEWWRRRRALDGCFVGYGTSDEAGDGLYKGTKFGAQNESSMDNSPIHDDAPFDPSTGMLKSVDVGLNSMFALDTEMLAVAAAELGRQEDAARYSELHRTLAKRISEELWDDKREIFANKLPNGEFIRQLAPTSFYPLAAGAATAEQARAMCDRHLESMSGFGGRFAMPSVARSDPSFADNVYWRGRIWAPMNYWPYVGLRRCGFDDEAARLAGRCQDLFDAEWRHRRCGENYNADSGRILDGSDADDFYSWGALFPLTTVQEVVQEDPWDGLSISPHLAEGGFGSVMTRFGHVSIPDGPGDWRVHLDGVPVLAGDTRGRLKNVAFSNGSLEADLPSGSAGQSLRVPAKSIIRAELSDDSTSWRPCNIDSTSPTEDAARLPERKSRTRIRLQFANRV